MPEIEEVTVTGQEMWLRRSGGVPTELNTAYILNASGAAGQTGLQDQRECFCVTKERPKVEYSYCDGGDPSDAAFTQCINEKLAEGWYPLSGFPNHHDRQGYNGSGGVFAAGYAQYTHASFWRWAE